ncbi:WD repeat-containing protein on Y chromosome-like [Pempheris klunzingeri]|uniref:WD repeat-containing protein on Y chromosome-like n=1 Tax=Pempheris klunzingeri TaxID=3127111 RepID=UPI00397FC51E
MERDTEEQPEEDAMGDLTNTGKMFSAKDIPEIVKLFREADVDGGGGLDMEEFCVAMETLYGTVSKEDLIALHMQIDTNCDKTVDIGELLDFLVNKNKALEKMDCKNQPFPKPMKMISLNQHRAIVALLFCPYEDKANENSCVPVGQTRTYQRGQYLTITTNGILNSWTDTFDTSYLIKLLKESNELPFSHKKKLHVNHMVHFSDLHQLAICTTDRQVLIYGISVFPELFGLVHCLIIEDNIVETMNYWSNGTKAVFSLGDVRGFLTVFISYDVKKNGLFFSKAYEGTTQRDFYVSTLLKNPSKDFLCVKVDMFNDICSQVRYFPTLDSIAVCGSSSMTMALVALPKEFKTSVSTKVFHSSKNKEFFTCVGYSIMAERLVTGGADGLLRVWFPHKTTACERELPGHVKPITHIEFNHKDKIFTTFSIDKNIRVWSEDDLLCRQSLLVEGMGMVPISTIYFNAYNNELFLINTNIGKYLGRGTDVFRNALTSHDKPLCSTLYHNIYKQVVSVCLNGVVTVWDVLTGKAVMEFKASPVQCVGLTTMAFDGAQRRLITVSQDRKVRLWNFNSGTELRVLPVTMPWQVTCIASFNNRLFVSGRKSHAIFDLDLEGYDNRYLEHDYLDGISSMDVHHDTLFTASSNGKIVIWDAETATALYWLDVPQNPRIQLLFKKHQGQTGTLPVKEIRKNTGNTGITLWHKKSRPLTGNENAMDFSPFVICLKTRDIDVNTATLLTCTDGYIQAWSVKIRGGLLGKFRAVEDEDAVITAMSTDVNEQILLTGDSTGKIYVWDIQEYGFKDQTEKGPFEEISRRRVSACPPPLLGSWQSHPTMVVSVQYVPSSSSIPSIVTAGLDCNIRLWTDTGCCIGIFGKDYWGAMQTSHQNRIYFSHPS